LEESVDKRPVVFRRINGRVVPIRSTRSDRDRAKGVAQGAGIAAAGVAVAGTSGKVYQKTVFNSVKKAADAFSSLERSFRSRSRVSPQVSFFEMAEREAERAKSYENLRKAAHASKAASGLRRAAIPVGAGLIGYGAVKAFNSLPKDRRNQISPEAAAGGTAVLGLVAPRALQVSKEAFEAGIGGKQGAFKFGRRGFDAVRPYLSKIVKAKF
jgi:hypothetical protein